MNEIIYKLPKDIKLSEHLQEKAIAYFKLSLFGNPYYIVITKEMKKAFKMQQSKGKILYSSFSTIQFEKILRDIVNSIQLQVCDDVCAGIEQSLDQEIKQGFSNMFKKYLHKRVKDKVDNRFLQLENKGDEK